ncbi:hypothetical protein CMUS01_05148 [Colletotrichum musicola]|uniref:Uncharacterized protein n=1 Tax=Colletotrichum musicola TaxID=2175873 RepID=A0A8H6NLJ8_9PEZI|nr:hypothetical protein CMUS01_05148 [Colletotrichum musicola]
MLRPVSCQTQDTLCLRRAKTRPATAAALNELTPWFAEEAWDPPAREAEHRPVPGLNPPRIPQLNRARLPARGVQARISPRARAARAQETAERSDTYMFVERTVDPGGDETARPGTDLVDDRGRTATPLTPRVQILFSLETSSHRAAQSEKIETGAPIRALGTAALDCIKICRWEHGSWRQGYLAAQTSFRQGNPKRRLKRGSFPNDTTVLLRV